MHREVLDFLIKVRLEFSEYFIEKKVLEVGSLNINGTPKELFYICDYIGIDRLEGNNVDIVCNIHEYNTTEKFDVVISTEMLEHDFYLDQSIEKMISLVSDSGLIIITCANINRSPHCHECSIDGYYKNIDIDMVKKWIKKYNVIGYIEEDSNRHDIRFIFSKNKNILKNLKILKGEVIGV